jgi:hypothetical protein
MQRYGREKVTSRGPPRPCPMRSTLARSVPEIEKILLRAAFGRCQGRSDPVREEDRQACSRQAGPRVPSQIAIGRVLRATPGRRAGPGLSAEPPR